MLYAFLNYGTVLNHIFDISTGVLQYVVLTCHFTCTGDGDDQPGGLQVL